MQSRSKFNLLLATVIAFAALSIQAAELNHSNVTQIAWGADGYFYFSTAGVVEGQFFQVSDQNNKVLISTIMSAYSTGKPVKFGVEDQVNALFWYSGGTFRRVQWFVTRP